MQNIVTTDAQIRAVIPNIQISVQGQTPWVDRLSSFLDKAESFVESMISPFSVIRDAGLTDQAAAVIIWRAWALALPSLDIVATPNGFAVVSNQNLAPASKARTEAARENALRMADESICILLDELRKISDWNTSRQSKRFHNLFPDPRELQRQFDVLCPAFEFYLRKEQELLINESILAANTLSMKGMNELRKITANFVRSGSSEDIDTDDIKIMDLARSAIVVMMQSDPYDRIMFRRIRDKILVTMDQSESSAVASLWRSSSLYKAFKMKPYENKKDSGGYFF